MSLKGNASLVQTWCKPGASKPCATLAGLGTHASCKRKPSHGDLIHMEGTAHTDLSRFETTEAINFKILPVMYM